MKKWCLAFLVGGAVLGIQTVKIERPFTGHFATYQTGIASMSRNMLRENFSELHLPKTDLIVQGKRSLHLNQYPIPSVLAALGVRFLGGSLEFWGRFQAIIFNLLSALLLYLIATGLFDQKKGWLAAVLYAFSPYTLIYGQSFMSEPVSLFLFLLSVYLLIRPAVEEDEGIWGAVFSGFLFSLAVVGRLHLILFYPFFAFLIASRKKIQRGTALLFFSLSAVILPLLWYGFTYYAALRFPNIHTNLFVQLGGGVEGAREHLLSLDYYRKIFDIVSGTMLTPLIFPFLFLGLFLKPIGEKGRGFIAGGLACGALQVLILPKKIFDHDFYLYGMFPFLVTAAALGLSKMFHAFPSLAKKTIGLAFLLLYLGVSSRYFLHPIFKSEDPAALLKIARSVQEKTQVEQPVIVAGQAPAVVFYYIDRPGWLMHFTQIGKEMAPYLKTPRFKKVDLKGIQELEEAMKDPVGWLEYLRKEGAIYFIAPKKEDLKSLPALLDHLETHYQKISEDDFYLYAVREPLT